MNLNEYIQSHPYGTLNLTRDKLAKELGVCSSLIRHWINGTRRIPAERAIQIAYATDWKVTLPELRPDIYPIDYRPPCPPANTANTPNAG